MSAVLAVLEKASKGMKLEEDELVAFRKEVIKARQELSRKVREFWASDVGQAVATMLSYQAEVSGYAGEVERVMSGVADELRRIAKATNIGGLYRWVWGKPKR